MAEVFRLVKKLNAAHQLTAILIPSTVNMMSVNDAQIILVATSQMTTVMTVMNLATMCRTAPTKFFPQKHHATKRDLIQGINTPTTKGTVNIPIMVLDIGDIPAVHSPTVITTVTEAAVLEGTPHTPLPATTAAHATLWPMDDPITTHALTPTGIVAPHPTFTISPADVIHATLQTRACLTPAPITSQHRNPSLEKPNNTQDPQPP